VGSLWAPSSLPLAAALAQIAGSKRSGGYEFPSIPSFFREGSQIPPFLVSKVI